MFNQKLKEIMLDNLDQLTDLFIQTIAKDVSELTSETYYLNYTNLYIDKLNPSSFIFTSNQNDLSLLWFNAERH